MFSYAFHQLLTIYVLTTSRALGFEFPSSVSADLALYSNINVTSICSGGGSTYNCTSACSYRNGFPNKQTPLNTRQSSCKALPGLPPDAAELENGGITFDETTTECVAVDNTYSSVSPKYFTLTTWVKASCTSQACDIFSIGTDLNMISSGNAISLNLESKPASVDAWIFIAIRYNGVVTWFLNGQQVHTFALYSLSTPYKLTLGPSENLTDSHVIHMADVRWYEDALTDREVTNVFNETWLDVGIRSKCRCPATHPTLSENTKPVKYMKCTDGNTEVLRLGENMHIPEFMLDNDISTTWISKRENETNITLSLGKQFQIKSISLNGIKHQPSSLTIILVRNGMETKFTGNGISGETFTHNLEPASISMRSDYEKLLADKVIIQAKFTSRSYFTVSELKLEARCNCYGNDQSCSINNGTYTCTCSSSSNTVQEHCKTCNSEYYRDASNFICNHPCDYNATGRTNTTCKETPKDLHLQPTYGPVAGGTLLTLTGTLLGNMTTVSLRFDGIQQAVYSRNLTSIIFKTINGKEGEKNISLYWTYQNLTYHAEEIENKRRFEYKANPQIHVPTHDIKSFASGGCILRIQGSNLDSVPYPKMLVHVQDNQDEDSLCTADAAELQCPTPNLSKYESNMTYSYGFRLDGHMDYENASAAHRTMLVVVPDPTVDVGTSETYKNTFDKIFRIKGERLNEACHDSDVTITLGDKNCALLTRTQDSISCDPGEEFPGTARTVKVKIKIGNFEKVVGELEINSFWTNTEFIFIAVGVGVFLIIVVVVIVCVCWCRKRKNYSGSKSQTDLTNLTDMSDTGSMRKPNNYEINPVAVVVPQENRKPERTSKMIAERFCERLKKNVGKIVTMSLIERSNIDIGKLCTHKGKRIRVLSGHYNASTSSPYSSSSFTVKTLVEPYAEDGDLPEWLSNGLQECTSLQDFVNDNVLRMKGIAVDAKNIYILYPEMSNRTLKDYIIKEPMEVDKKQEICIQVADGMNYLSSQGVVHKDLAARNCWVSRDFEVKISDASFSYDLYPEEYLEKNGRFQPVRWMAPESLRQGFYDPKSDVWSYGILVWEVYSNGYLPYYDIKSNEDIQQKVCDEHFRLGKPSLDCPDGIFEIIEECHKDRSDDRPNFFIIKNKLDDILNSAEQDLPLYENREFTTADTDDGMEDYVNTQFAQVPSRPPRPMKS